MPKKDRELRKEYDFSTASRGPIVPPTPGKTRVTVRLDNEVLEWFRARVHAAGGGNYQTLLNDALKEYIRGHQIEALLRRVIREELQPVA